MAEVDAVSDAVALEVRVEDWLRDAVARGDVVRVTRIEGESVVVAVVVLEDVPDTLVDPVPVALRVSRMVLEPVALVLGVFVTKVVALCVVVLVTEALEVVLTEGEREGRNVPLVEPERVFTGLADVEWLLALEAVGVIVKGATFELDAVDVAERVAVSDAVVV